MADVHFGLGVRRGAVPAPAKDGCVSAPHVTRTAPTCGSHGPIRKLTPCIAQNARTGARATSANLSCAHMPSALAALLGLGTGRPLQTIDACTHHHHHHHHLLLLQKWFVSTSRAHDFWCTIGIPCRGPLTDTCRQGRYARKKICHTHTHTTDTRTTRQTGAARNHSGRRAGRSCPGEGQLLAPGTPRACWSQFGSVAHTWTG